MKTKGFTIMELTIAILAVSAVLVMLTFPFKENLKITRDTVRQANVIMMANIIKLDQIDAYKKYNISKNDVLEIFNKNSMPFPIIESNNHYYFGHSTKNENFFIVVCKESRENFFVAGTDGGKKALSIIYPQQACKNRTIPIGERYIPIKNSNKPIDSYIIYKII